MATAGGFFGGEGIHEDAAWKGVQAEEDNSASLLGQVALGSLSPPVCTL